MIAGEGEAPFQNLIRFIQGKNQIISMYNIAYREGKEIRFDRQSMSDRGLDEIPCPAYLLVDMDKYFALKPYKLVCFELARGCYLNV